ncbi:putative serine protease K12H4.7 [Scaptodrosophila lebanonensis]|uniref:Serine protease K12H4.7 n=1 Tax=Drosophila lebanonensis TaxID=7225 RepID=A0A6J2TGR3_DROLE|nr:putative serine protease K12H4.7 [Scaptodrosophila lebanonensis]
MAVENGGMLYYTEHRYYGKSWPLGNDSLSQLEYLSVRQALADLAHFISYQKSHSAHLANAKVILVGGSYSGSMVAWMADLYPELIDASWASSAPLLAKADFNEYMEMVSNSINLRYGRKCTQRIRRGLQYLAHILNGNESREVLEQLNACPHFNVSDQLDRAAFFNGIDNYFALIVQSYSSYIPDLCETLMSLHPTDEQAMFKFLQLLYGKNGSNCLDFSYKAMLQLFTDLSDQNSGTRAWFFQTCNEFGWYTTTAGSGSSDFANQVPLLFFECLCRDAFGRRQTAAHLTDGIAQTNAQFGGLNFNQTVRYRQVFFTHGELDPWRALGKQFGHQALLIPGYSHCEDLGSINVGQSIPMNLAKLRVMSFLRRHLYSQLH